MRGGGLPLAARDAGVPQEQRLGPEVGERVKGWLESYGVDLRYLGTEVEGIERENGGFRVTVEGGESISTGTVLFGTGVSPRMQLAEEAKLEIEEGGVVTDSSMRTSGSDIFAVGDIAFAMNESAGERQKVEHWGEALEHGRIAGTVLAGGEASWSMAPGFWSTMGEKTLKYWSWSGGWDEAHFVDHVERGEAGEASESCSVCTAGTGSASVSSPTTATKTTRKAVKSSRAEHYFHDDTDAPAARPGAKGLCRSPRPQRGRARRLLPQVARVSVRGPR
jgi:hypothetical protein